MYAEFIKYPKLFIHSFASEASYTQLNTKYEVHKCETKPYVNSYQIPKMYIDVCLELLYYKKTHQDLIYHIGTKLF